MENTLSWESGDLDSSLGLILTGCGTSSKRINFSGLSFPTSATRRLVSVLSRPLDSMTMHRARLWLIPSVKSNSTCKCYSDQSAQNTVLISTDGFGGRQDPWTSSTAGEVVLGTPLGSLQSQEEGWVIIPLHRQRN